jgi:transmembrane sensor
MKTSHDSISEELLARYFELTATADEINQVSQWIDRSPQNARDLDAFRVLWEASRRVGGKKAFNTNAAWENIAKKIKDTGGNGGNSNHAPLYQEGMGRGKRKFWSVTFVAAAVVALLAMAFGWFQLSDGKIPIEPLLTSVSTRENVKETVLPDGSKVFLNYHSKLTYPEHFTGDTRSVTLTGEAFFEVHHDTLHPFIIQANGSEIKVLGTSFNVKAYDNKSVRVDVSDGKVLVRNANHEIYLTKNQSAEALPDTVRMVLPNANLTGYRTGIFDFSATHLEEVVSSIRHGYHADVRLASDRLSQCRLTIRFEKEPLEETLSVIAESLSLKLRKDGKTYWLEGTGCQ